MRVKLEMLLSHLFLRIEKPWGFQKERILLLPKIVYNGDVLLTYCSVSYSTGSSE